ncbi:alpha/beta fold hydrolase [Levilactobacillus suantsaiihabitans]|uniref:Alpha/beta hydrolase n=1 Tax=Levilactobacillus suantsaiihabitans TaxID=2487722 RepID=A0A4Z0J8I0_9LACO|nr:alpha/beta hydrolase [Levilactobacillus suantsaiihabitans]TGD17738.1 alpha/beta hydrolase [Levilactobacillus suantsaiihabitans]
MNFKTNDGVNIVYDDQGSGTPIVILTGIGGSRKIWAAQVPVLVAAGYRVINIDARNQGASDQTVQGRRITRHAMDVAELLAALKVDQAILLGNSLGAATFFAYLSLFGEAHVKAVIDVDQSPKMVAEAGWPYGFKQLTWDNFPQLLAEPMGKSTAGRIDDGVYAQIHAEKQTHPYDAALNYPLMIDHAAQDWRDVLLHLQAPFLIIAGGKSPFFNPEFAAIAAKLAHHGTAKIVPDAGHIVMAEQPAQFNQILLAFLKTLD